MPASRDKTATAPKLGDNKAPVEVIDHLTGEVLPRNTLTVEEWAEDINGHLQGHVDAILHACKRLVVAQSQIEEGNWLRFVSMLRYGPRSVQMLLAIGRCEFLHDANHGSHLPGSWRTLFELSQLSRAQFEGAVAAGLIRPDMERKEALQLGNGVNALKAFSGNNEYYTPAQFIEAAREVMGGIDLDPASCDLAQETVRAKVYYTQEDDGLAQPWRGRVWMNPPYAAGLIDRFAAKLVQEFDAGHVEAAIALVDNRTDTGWFYSMAAACDRLCFTRGRINFYNENTASSSPANGSALFYFGDKPKRFEHVFSRFGWGGQVTFTRTSGEAANAA